MNAFLLAAVMLLGSGPASTTDATVTVHIQNGAYVPAAIAVAPGTVVRFVNDDSEAHTVTATNNAFDSTGLEPGNAWAYRFGKPGTYAYYCVLHPRIRGKITVRTT
jgi:plastocyanin